MMGVPKPWDHVVITTGENKFIVNVWGRSYMFDKSFLPTSMISMGQELFYAPAVLHLEMNGEERVIHHFSFEVFQESDEKVTVICSALCGNLVINAEVEIAYDGFLKLAIRLVPCGEFNYIDEWERAEDQRTGGTLEKAWIEWKFEEKASSLFHFWPNGESGVRVLGLINSGSFFEGELPFKPCIWIGNEDCGLNICMESEKALRLDGKPYLEMYQRDGFREVKMNLLNSIPKVWDQQEEKWLHNLPPVTFEILLQATPVKPWNEELAENWRVYHTDFQEIDVEELAKQGFRWLILHENWSRIQNYCMPVDKVLLEDIVKRAHASGMKVLAYFGYEYSSAVPGFHEHMDEYLNKTQEGYFTGGWTRGGQNQKAYIACYHGGYSDEMIETCKMAMDKYDLDGIYTDGTYVPWECANESHGCGYRDDEGNLHMTWPILATRRHVEKLYKAVHERGGVIDTHQSSCCLMPTLAFCDSYFDGENIQNNIREGMGDFLSMETFRCEFMGRNFGIIPHLIAYVDEETYRMRNLLAISLPHNVLPRPMKPWATEDIKKIWNTYDDFGVRNAEWKPYWKKESAVTCEEEGVYISTFEKEEKILVILSDFRKSRKMVTLQLPEKMNFAHEIFDNREYEIQEGKLKFFPDYSAAYMFEIWMIPHEIMDEGTNLEVN